MLITRVHFFNYWYDSKVKHLIRFLNTIPPSFWESENHGKGLLNNIINSLPFELHAPGYNFLGPGTKLKERLERGDKPINPLDSAAMEHDLAYHHHKNLEERHIADKELEKKAFKRMFSPDADLSEKMWAGLTGSAMHIKRKLGWGIKMR